MKLGIISDTHSNYTAVEAALAILRQRNITRVIHCGDICDAATVQLFKGFSADFVMGNCDHDREGLREAIGQAGATLHESFGELELCGVKLAFVHGDDSSMLAGLEHSGHFDFVFYGHTHVAREHQRGKTRVINPGALYRVRTRSMAILELTSGKVETVIVN